MMHPVILRAEKLAYEVGGHVLLSDIDFMLKAREVVTVLGPNGAGKSRS